MSVNGRPPCILDLLMILASYEAAKENCETSQQEWEKQRRPLEGELVQRENPHQLISSQELEVGIFKYLKSVITQEDTFVKEIKTRISLASEWKSKPIKVTIKLKLYKSLISSIETWTLNEKGKTYSCFRDEELSRATGHALHRT